MDISIIIIVALGIIAFVGGPIIGHLASKSSQEAEKEGVNQSKNK